MISYKKSMRLQHYDYSSNVYYFVTICTRDRKNFFGSIENEKVILNKYGNIVNTFWQEIPLHYKNVYLDEYIIMPNHIHGIIIIDEQCKRSVVDEQCSSDTNTNKEQCSSTTEKEQCSSITDREHNSLLQLKKNNYGLLSKIIKSFKEACIKKIKKEYNDDNFFWMKSFYDHIIRNKKSLNNIRNYINYNFLKQYDNDKIINTFHQINM